MVLFLFPSVFLCISRSPLCFYTAFSLMQWCVIVAFVSSVHNFSYVSSMGWFISRESAKQFSTTKKKEVFRILRLQPVRWDGWMVIGIVKGRKAW
ncbi:hypothetical protein BDZ91DRAFT_724769 [Kalaharituber pfeilii]|nr:hypothetical protein BDZ91DRAFT_724769 [Kalaharituber pfeilii]